MGGISFAAASRLWLLLPLVVAAVAGLVLLGRRRRTEEPYAEPALMPAVAPRRSGGGGPARGAGVDPRGAPPPVGVAMAGRRGRPGPRDDRADHGIRSTAGARG